MTPAAMVGGTGEEPSRSSTRIQRVLTITPLARQHEKLLAVRASGRQFKIPWASFDRSAHPEPALALACNAQRALACGEYGAVDLFARLASSLALNGAPFDLVAAAAQIPSDEVRHADYTLRMASLCAGHDVAIDVDVPRTFRTALSLGELDVQMMEISAVGETLACALLAACKERATDPVAHAIYAAIVSDEVHHARLGWYYLSWRAAQWTLPERQRVADRAGELVMDAETRFWTGRDAAPRYRSAARALGVLESKGQREVVRRIMVDEIVPALDAFGLGASHAWRVRRRGKS